jgi:hypothetical protein
MMNKRVTDLARWQTAKELFRAVRLWSNQDLIAHDRVPFEVRVEQALSSFGPVGSIDSREGKLKGAWKSHFQGMTTMGQSW